MWLAKRHLLTRRSLAQGPLLLLGSNLGIHGASVCRLSLCCLRRPLGLLLSLHGLKRGGSRGSAVYLLGRPHRLSSGLRLRRLKRLGGLGSGCLRWSGWLDRSWRLLLGGSIEVGHQEG